MNVKINGVEYVTAENAAVILEKSIKTVYRLVNTNKLRNTVYISRSGKRQKLYISKTEAANFNNRKKTGVSQAVEILLRS